MSARAWEYMRLVTPILVSLSLTVLGLVYQEMREIRSDVTQLKVDVAVLKARAQ